LAAIWSQFGRNLPQSDRNLAAISRLTFSPHRVTISVGFGIGISMMASFSVPLRRSKAGAVFFCSFGGGNKGEIERHFPQFYPISPNLPPNFFKRKIYVLAANHGKTWIFLFKFGPSDWIRTSGLLNPIQAKVLVNQGFFSCEGEIGGE